MFSKIYSDFPLAPIRPYRNAIHSILQRRFKDIEKDETLKKEQ
jgi:hypothetical protein